MLLEASWVASHLAWESHQRPPPTNWTSCVSALQHSPIHCKSRAIACQSKPAPALLHLSLPLESHQRPPLTHQWKLLQTSLLPSVFERPLAYLICLYPFIFPVLSFFRCQQKSPTAFPMVFITAGYFGYTRFEVLLSSILLAYPFSPSSSS